MTSEADLERISERDFARIARSAKELAGIDLPISKLGMIQSRLFRNMRRERFRGRISDYVDVILSDTDRRGNLISVLTTNVTGFYREPHHFQTLSDWMSRRAPSHNERIRIWSAGCSAGHEPYTVAMTLADLWPDFAMRNVRVLATDIDEDILSRARSGVYSDEEIAKLSQPTLKRHFERLDGAQPRAHRVKSELSERIAFRHLNLHGPWPMRGPFDAIFCRNVVIYFAEAERAALWPRFRDMLVPGGLLFIGHSERIQSPEACGFEPAGVTTFRKSSAGAPMSGAGGSTWH